MWYYKILAKTSYNGDKTTTQQTMRVPILNAHHNYQYDKISTNYYEAL